MVDLKRIEKFSISFVTFFIYQGYYAGLALIISLGYLDLSRFYSVPLRLICLFIMILIIKNNLKVSNKNKMVLFLFALFWFIYLFKLLYHYNMNYPLYRSSWIEYFFYALAFCIFPFYTFFSIDYRKYKSIIYESLIFSGFVMGLVSLFLYKEMLFLGVGRISDLRYVDNNIGETISPLALSYAGVLTITLCLMKFIYFSFKNKFEFIYIIVTILLSLVMFFLGSSRGSIIAIFFSYLLFLIYGNFKSKFKSYLILIISLPVLIFGAIISGSNIFDRVNSTVESDTIGRGEIWDLAIDEFLNFPILGNRIEIDLYPHNIFLEVLMSTGIVGFIFFSVILFICIKLIVKFSYKDMYNIVPFVILIQGICQHFVTGALYFAILIFVSMGMILSINNYYGK